MKKMRGMNRMIVTSLVILVVGTWPAFTTPFHYTTTPHSDIPQPTVGMTVSETATQTIDQTDGEVVTMMGSNDGNTTETPTSSQLTGRRGEGIVDKEVEVETRSFYSSRRKNKVSEGHHGGYNHKSKDKSSKHSDMDSKLRITDLSDDLDTWEAPEDLKKNYPYYLAGYDSEERPLWVAEYGRFNVRQLIEQGKESTAQLEKYAKQAAYRIIRSIRVRNKEVGDVSEACAIIDLDGLSLYQLSHPATLVFVMRMTRIYADLLDKFVGRAVIINANYIAETLINLVRPSFGTVMEKVDIYGTQPSKWRPALRQLFPPEAIPSWYGGSQGFKPIKVYG